MQYRIKRIDFTNVTIFKTFHVWFSSKQRKSRFYPFRNNDGEMGQSARLRRSRDRRHAASGNWVAGEGRSSTFRDNKIVQLHHLPEIDNVMLLKSTPRHENSAQDDSLTIDRWHFRREKKNHCN
ncbi:hypothetical protein NPIL_465971 [Nephila pilipes]|uniref:Uncharacterized protein n=1 Tax=Nephila pilipes TaxID=299642 RepID=A0A8X6PNJ7_NEPPI|nr:hypothetical protein NPIL_465971 [Nephila pilipes]